EKLEGRLNGLNAVSADVDHKLREQLARRSELETLKATVDGLSAQVDDAGQKLEAVRALQTSLVPLVEEVSHLKREIVAAEARLDSTEFTEAAVLEQQKRYAELAAASRAAASEVAERTRQMQTLAEELSRSAKVKDDMLGELDRIQG